jgi:hypothetical protein
VDQAQPVHGVDDVGVPGDAGHLVGLQLADEMPAEVQAGAGGGLGRRLLITVLAEVPLTELVQQPDVRGGPGLGHRDESDLVAGPARCRAGGVDPAPDLRQPVRQLGPASFVPFAHRGLSVT